MTHTPFQQMTAVSPKKSLPYFTKLLNHKEDEHLVTAESTVLPWLLKIAVTGANQQDGQAKALAFKPQLPGLAFSY